MWVELQWQARLPGNQRRPTTLKSPRKANGSPRTRQSNLILAAFRPWGGSGDAVARGTTSSIRKNEC